MGGSGLAHGLKLLRGGSKSGLDRGDFAGPSLFPGFGEAVDEVGVDLFEPGLLSWVNAKERASGTSQFAGVHIRLRGRWP